MESIIPALVTGFATVLAAILTNLQTGRKSEEAIRTAQAVTDVKLDALTREERRHNSFATRMPAVEEQLRALSRRLEALESAEAKKK